ncbi:MAG: 3-oxoadipate enol-lactonase [Pseudonocardiales bacterium]|nr:3-oxoadipate enol-lactonase [Pseudonocardiales bacterium]
MPILTVNGAAVAYSDTGVPKARADAPTVVFGHGLLFSKWMFGAQIAALRADYRCIALDWRGQGDTPPTESGYDMDTLSLDAIGLVEELVGGPVHWVGLSMGGFVGQRIAARRPELIRSLVLLDTSADPEDRKTAIQDKALAEVYRFTGLAPIRKQVERIMFAPTFYRDPAKRAVIEDWVQQLRPLDRNGIRKAVVAVANRRGISDEIGSIVAPTLVIVGADDVPTPVKRARRIAELIPGARLEVVPYCGHSSSIEQPAAVTALIQPFLAEVDAAASAPQAD